MIETLIRQLATGNRVEKTAELEVALHELGIAFRAQNQHIELVAPLELLDETTLRAGISEPARKLITQLDVEWQIGSTNTELMARKKDAHFNGSICVAEQQTAGKGRRGRSWISPFASNIYLSFGWRIPRQNMAEALSLYIGMNLVDCLREAGLEDVGMKWPNDIIVGQGKLAGILIELELAASSAYIVAGIGVNLSKEPVLREGPGQLVSAVADQLSLGRNALCSLIIDRMVMSMNEVSSHHIAERIAEWPKYDRYSGKEVVVHRGDEQIVGINGGIDERGNLLLDLGTEIRSFGSGEVSLRKTESNL